MGMERHGQIHSFLQAADQRKGRLGVEKPRHILDRDGIAPHGRHGPSLLDEKLRAVHRARGVAQRALSVAVFTAAMAVSTLRMSFMASKMRKTSMPWPAA